jgi:hypothetical protein
MNGAELRLASELADYTTQLKRQRDIMARALLEIAGQQQFDAISDPTWAIRRAVTALDECDRHGRAS